MLYWLQFQYVFFLYEQVLTIFLWNEEKRLNCNSVYDVQNAINSGTDKLGMDIFPTGASPS